MWSALQNNALLHARSNRKILVSDHVKVDAGGRAPAKGRRVPHQNLLLVPRRFDVLVPLIQCGASAGPAPEEGRNTLPPRAIVDSCTDLDRAQDSRTHPVRCHDVLEIPPCCPCSHEQRPVGPSPVMDEEGTVRECAPPSSTAPCAREDTTGPDLVHCFAKITGRKDLPCPSLQGAQPRASRSQLEVEDPGAKIHRLSRWEHQRVPGVLR